MQTGLKEPVTEGDFFRQPLREHINLKHPLVGLVDLNNWERLAHLWIWSR
uniref:Transposase n=1 Tax=Paraburkholderia sprentiae WSM5005 TaxID=754502 RepID=A0A1I9YW95_9BURK